MQVTNFDLCLHIVMVTGKCTDVFGGIFCLGGYLRGGGYLGGYFHGETCHGEENFNEGAQGFLALFEKEE